MNTFQRLAIAAGGLVTGLVLGAIVDLGGAAYLFAGVGPPGASRDVPFAVFLIVEAVVLVPVFGGGSSLARGGRLAPGLFLMVTCVAALLPVGLFDVTIVRSLHTPAAWRL